MRLWYIPFTGGILQCKITAFIVLCLLETDSWAIIALKSFLMLIVSNLCYNLSVDIIWLQPVMSLYKNEMHLCAIDYGHEHQQMTFCCPCLYICMCIHCPWRVVRGSDVRCFGCGRYSEIIGKYSGTPNNGHCI